MGRVNRQMLVSILIPCFNAERWIAQAIESALAQTWPNAEVIVVDDGSTDGSLEIIKSFGSRIRWETGRNRGGGAARNRLLELSRGEWIQYLDADDYLLPEKIEGQMAFVAARADADVVFGAVTMAHWSKEGERHHLLPIPQPHDLWVLLARWYLPQTGALLWRKQALMEVGGWNPDQPCCQEHELYLRALIAGKRFAYCATNGAVYRQWSEHTVCRRDKAEVRRRRLAIEQRAEDVLRFRGALTPERQWAINQARFEMARIAWQTNRSEARLIIDTIKRSQPDFIPGGQAAPGHYRALYRALGFRPVELLAEWRRRIMGAPDAA